MIDISLITRLNVFPSLSCMVSRERDSNTLYLVVGANSYTIMITSSFSSFSDCL